MKKIVIVDYKLGNLFSVKHVCDFIGLNADITSDINKVKQSDAIILPGVGAFQEGMNNLRALSLDSAIKEKVKSGTPIFGICLGLQMLFTESEEFGVHQGLDIVSGKILKFPDSHKNKRLRIPQIGWNTVNVQSNLIKSNLSIFDINSGDHFYFVHSFYALPKDENMVLTKTTYNGFEYCSSIFNGTNIFATQFHPEKSGIKGLGVYKKWASINNLL